MKQVVLAMCLTCLALFSACETPTEYTAEAYTINEIVSQPGYSWITTEMGAYTPNSQYVNQIKTAYQANPVAFDLFVKPTCTCKGTTKHFPRLLKTLREAGVPDNAVTIYSMRDVTTKHPTTDKYTIKDLPTFFLTRGTSQVGNVVATFDETVQIDSTVAVILK